MNGKKVNFDDRKIKKVTLTKNIYIYIYIYLTLMILMLIKY